MPIFEFKCEQCQDRTEKLMSYDDTKKVHRCEKCNGLLYREWSCPPNFRITGMGVYKPTSNMKD